MVQFVSHGGFFCDARVRIGRATLLVGCDLQQILVCLRSVRNRSPVDLVDLNKLDLLDIFDQDDPEDRVANKSSFERY